MKDILKKLLLKVNLTQDEMEYCLEDLMDGKIHPVIAGSFLTALKMKGETVEEIVGAAKVIRKRAESLDIKNMELLDTCGTGGDGSNTFNVSTAVAFVAAAAGIPVAKHGNRSVSSKSGSADVLEALGANIYLNSAEINEAINITNVGFIFAQVFHKGMKNAAEIRKSLAFPTIFNILGPLTNPAGVSFQVIGVYRPDMTEMVAEAAKHLGVKRAMVVHGRGMDEIAISGPTKVTELKDEKIKTYYITPGDLGLKMTPKEYIVGGDAKVNQQIIYDIFNGQKGPKRDFLLANSAAAIYIGGVASTLREGVEIASQMIDKGYAASKLQEYVKFSQRVGRGKTACI